MKSVSTPFAKPATSLTEKRKTITQALIQCRYQIEKLTDGINNETLTQQSHPDFSPIGWHLGHIAFTEAYWILEQLGGFSPLYPEYHKLFAADGLPKAERQNLPPHDAIKKYLATVRNKVVDYLETAPLATQERLWWWLIQHELQHGETIAFVKKLHRSNNKTVSISENTSNIFAPIKQAMVFIPQESFVMGSEAIEAQDNERPAHLVHLDSYYIDAYPVTCGQYQQFITANGYQNPQYWSKEGWQWKQKNTVPQPLYWSNEPKYQNHPVYGVSYYEAEAYANFVGKRLPTEAEWEKAAQFHQTEPENHSFLGNHSNLVGDTTAVNPDSKTHNIWGCYDMFGNIWEWTDSWFAPYQGFSSYPYKGYSEVYFDSQHKVLKGGSYITLSYGIRSSFRNWYHPWVRQMFAGFRCAKDVV